jgi:hypothetical protein
MRIKNVTDYELGWRGRLFSPGGEIEVGDKEGAAMTGSNPMQFHVVSGAPSNPEHRMLDTRAADSSPHHHYFRKDGECGCGATGEPGTRRR